MKCLVTGATGFIGSALNKRLVREGHSVKAMIHKKKPKYMDDTVHYILADITNPASLKSIIDDIDVVFHCAALVRDYGPKKDFFKINVEGTKILANLCKNNIERFIFLSHIQYESKRPSSYYTLSKIQAENYLLKKYKDEKFPSVIIRPGNVYGPGATIWVLRPVQAIKSNRITLINGGKGIFHHTYIDNILDVLMAAMQNHNAIGESFDVTDGDHSITYGTYFNDLAKLIGKQPITKNYSKNTVLFYARLMMVMHTLFRIKPLITPTAVDIFTNNKKISIEKAKQLLGYEPKINYDEGMKQIRKWLQDEGLI